MDQNDRKVIDELFGKLGEAERQTGPRDGEAEHYIADQVGRQPAAPYYMAQAIVIQEQALAAANARIQELESSLENRPAGGGGFLAGLFGAGQPATRPRRGSGGHGAPSRGMQGAYGHVGQGHSGGPWGRPGGSFLGGALQTAMAVAGGLVVGNMISDLLAPDPAMAEEPAAEPEETGAEEDYGAEEDFGGGEDFGGDEF